MYDLIESKFQRYDGELHWLNENGCRDRIEGENHHAKYELKYQSPVLNEHMYIECRKCTRIYPQNWKFLQLVKFKKKAIDAINRIYFQYWLQEKT